MVAIVVEGKRDVTFYKNLIKEVFNIDKSKYNIIKTDGKSKLLNKSLDKYQDLLKSIKVGRIRKVLFIIDADDSKDNKEIGGYLNSQDKIEELIKDLDIELYSDYFIACNPLTQKGNIENLVISTLTEDEEKCIKSFLNCSELENSNNSKRLLGIYNYGFPDKTFDYNHPNFNELKQKLTNLFKEE